MTDDLTLFGELIGAIMVVAMLLFFLWITFRKKG
jgi:hypothetical protein